MSDRNEMIVWAGIDAWNNDDRTALESQWVEEPSITAPEGWPEAGEFHGLKAVMGQFDRLKTAWSDEHIDLISGRVGRRQGSDRGSLARPRGEQRAQARYEALERLHVG